MFLFHKDFAEKKTKHSSLLFLGRSFFFGASLSHDIFLLLAHIALLRNFIYRLTRRLAFPPRSSASPFKQIGLLRDFSNRKSTTLRLAIIPLWHIKSMFHLPDKEEAARVGAKSESQSNNRNPLMPRGSMNVG